MEGIGQSTVETIYVKTNQLDDVQRSRVIAMDRFVRYDL